MLSRTIQRVSPHEELSKTNQYDGSEVNIDYGYEDYAEAFEDADESATAAEMIDDAIKCSELTVETFPNALGSTKAARSLYVDRQGSPCLRHTLTKLEDGIHIGRLRIRNSGVSRTP